MAPRDTTGRWRDLLGFGALLLGIGLFAAPGALAAPTLEDRVRGVDRNAAQRLLPIGLAAMKAKQRDLGLRILARVVDLDPENSTARRDLGFVRGADGWTQAKTPEGGSPPPEDAEASERAARWAEDVLAVETWRAKEVVKIARASASPEAARPHLLALLDRLPRLEEVHVALGHEKVGARYVRPDLRRIAADGPARAAAWRALATPTLEAHVTEESLEVPGHGSWPWVRSGPRKAAGTFERPTIVYRVRRMEGAHALLRLLFGDDVPRYDPASVCLLKPEAYEAFLRARHDAPTAARLVKSGTYRYKGGLALRIRALSSALDFYSHTVAYFTAEQLACPRTKGPDGEEVLQDDAYAWFQEGMGYLVSLELWDTADTHFFSKAESHAKLASPLPEPEPANRDTLLAWVGANLLAGRGLPLRDVVTRSLNALDFHASMEAWTFLRFLALLDPDAFRRLPAALAAQVAGAQADRVDAALQATYRRGLTDLEALWRAWLLEVV